MDLMDLNNYFSNGFWGRFFHLHKLLHTPELKKSLTKFCVDDTVLPDITDKESFKNAVEIVINKSPMLTLSSFVGFYVLSSNLDGQNNIRYKLSILHDIAIAIEREITSKRLESKIDSLSSVFLDVKEFKDLKKDFDEFKNL